MKPLESEQIVKKILTELGFKEIGYTDISETEPENWYLPWLDKKYHANMIWLEEHISIRKNPVSIEDYGKSIITMALPYYTEEPTEWKSEKLISCYGWGDDYHHKIKKKLKTALKLLSEQIPDFKGREFVDTAPLPEKVLAQKTGIGWIGNNTLVINKKYGSYFFLAEIVTNLELEPTKEAQNYCGNCTKCIDACPTGALKPGKLLDARICRSWLTIEKQGDFSEEEEKLLKDGLAFGCDICQRVCPWNKKVEVTTDADFSCRPEWTKISLEELAELDQKKFDQLKIKSPVKRAKLAGIQRNAKTILKNKK